MSDNSAQSDSIKAHEQDKKTSFQAELLYNRLAKRYRHLKKWARRIGTNAFRLYDRDIPEIPLVLDIYGDAVSGAIFKKPWEKNEVDKISVKADMEQTEKWLMAMRSSIAAALGISEDSIFLKERQRMKDRQERGSQYVKLKGKSYYKDVNEGDMIFRVNLCAYIDTGLFLDARKKRALIRSEAEGKRVLNLFAYTCTLSVCAAMGAAAQVDSVDSSNTYIEWGKINFALNGIAVNDLTERGRFNFIKSDVFYYLEQAEKKRTRWDLIILDPPSFSNSKKMRGTLDIKRDHNRLINCCLSLLNPGGTLWFSANKKGLSLENKAFPGFTTKDMRAELVDEDFRGKRIPLCFKIY